MFDNLLLIIAVFGTLSGMSLPQALSQPNWIVFPSHHLAEPVDVKVLPAPVFRTIPEKIDADTGPSITAISAIIMDADSGVVLWEKEPDTVLPIASITKLMTAYVAEDYITNWDDPYTLTWGEISLGGSAFAGGVGDTFTKHDLLKTTLVGSINAAAAAVAHSTGLPEAEFVAAMNAKAQLLGMTHTHYAEPTGLSAENVSTSRELALLLRTISADDFLLEPMGATEHRMARQNDPQNEVLVKTTNRLIKNHEQYVIAGKTGFTYEAGNCLATIAEDEAGNQIFVVLLGAPDEDSRFEDSAELVHWAFDHYQW